MPKLDGLIDRRVVSRNVKHGRLTRKEFDQYLASLPDVSGKAVPMFSEVRASAIPVSPAADDDDEDEDEDELDD
jgi:hypothetical protein